MPEFASGEAKTAVVSVAVRPSGLGCEAELFLGPDAMTKAATSGRIPFVSTGASQNVHLSLFMPSARDSYHVYANIYADNYLIASYQAIEDVVIVRMPLDIIWE